MTTLKLHYDGWLALPADFRRKLGLGKGQAVEAELVGGTIVLRPVAGKAAGPVADEEPEAAAPAAAPAEAPAKQRARRKQAASAGVPLPGPRSRGRKARAGNGTLAS